MGKERLKVWTGIGTYVLANAGAIALTVTDTAHAEMTDSSGNLASTLIAQRNTCRAIAVTGGGEGGEGGEESVMPTVRDEGGEGGEGGESSESIAIPSHDEGGEGGESGESIAIPSRDEGGEGGEGGEEIVPLGTTRVFLPPNQQFRDRQIITDFVDQVIVPNYRLLSQQSNELASAIDAFVVTPNPTTLDAARQAWLATRTPWEQSEAFAFGPAASLGLDAELDDWPLNQADVEAVLNSTDALTPEAVSGLQTSQKGFQALGFLLFGSDNDKPLSAFTSRELAYLGAIAPVFADTANTLLSSWVDGVDGYPPYRTEFVNAGQGSSAYPTVQAAGAEIVQGILGILDELGTTKIGEALDSQNPFLLEGRFSQTSLQDFQANLLSAQNAYLGDFPAGGTHGRGLSEFVSAIDPNLDAQIRQQLQVASSALADIPAPIEQSLCDRVALPYIETAQERVLELFETFEQRVLPLVQQ